ncbi:integrase [Amaricoccus sp. W119]
MSGLRWAYRHRGLALARDGGQIADILAAIRRAHGAPPDSKAPLSAQDLLAMVATLPYDLRGLRDRALLLLGFAAGTRRSQIVGLDCAPNDTTGQAGWIEIEPRGALLVLKDKTGWREVEVGRGSNDRSCPVRALESWLSYAKIDTGPVFRRVSRDGRRPLAARLSDKHVARLIKRTVLASGIRSDLPEAERLRLYSGHSLRGDLAGSTEDGARRLGHAATGMAGEGRSDERYRVNRTKASGL